MVRGKATGRRLSIAVYSAESGDSVITGAVPWRGKRPTKKQVKQALQLIEGALSQLAPPPEEPAAPDPPPAATEAPIGAPIEEPIEEPLSFDPDEAASDGIEPLPEDMGGDMMGEDPLASPRRPSRSNRPTGARRRRAETVASPPKTRGSSATRG